MKDATISCFKILGNCLCTKHGFYWRCKRVPYCWMVKFSFSKSFISRKAGPKILSMYTFVLTLAPCFTKIRRHFPVFDTAAQTMTDAGFKRLTCLQERPLNVGQHYVVLWIELCLQSDFFFVWKNDFTLPHARFQQSPKKTSSFSSFVVEGQ